MKVLYIDSVNQGVQEVNLPPDRDAHLTSLRFLVGKETPDPKPTLCTFRLENGDVVFLDDNGMLGETDTCFVLNGADQPFIGNAVVVGPPDDEGNSTEAQTTLTELAERVAFCKRTDFNPEYWEQLKTMKVVSLTEPELKSFLGIKD